MCPGNKTQRIRGIVTYELNFLNLRSFMPLIANLWLIPHLKTIQLLACLLNSMWVSLLELYLEYFSQK